MWVAVRNVTQILCQALQMIQRRFIQRDDLRGEGGQGQSRRRQLAQAALCQRLRDGLEEALQGSRSRGQQTLAHRFIGHLHDGIGARRFQTQSAPDRAEVLGLSDDSNQEGQPQLVKRKGRRAPMRTLAVGHQRRGRRLRLDEELFQKRDDLLSQRGRGRPWWRNARAWLHGHDCCIMHSRKSFLIPNNSHERIFLHFLCLCKSILNLVVPHALAVNQYPSSSEQAHQCPEGRGRLGVDGRALMVARVLFPWLTSWGNMMTPPQRATIKALPTPHRPPSPLRITRPPA